jgi:hypothetical protein
MAEVGYTPIVFETMPIISGVLNPENNLQTHLIGYFDSNNVPSTSHFCTNSPKCKSTPDNP